MDGVEEAVRVSGQHYQGGRNHEGRESHEVEQKESVNKILKKEVDGRIRPL